MIEKNFEIVYEQIRMCSRIVQCVIETNSKLNNNDNGTTASFLIQRERFCDYVVCRLLKKYLLRSSVKYVSLLGVEENVNGVVYYIFDQQRNVIRAAHKNYFMKQVQKSYLYSGKVLSGQGVTVLLINRVVEAEVQGKTWARNSGSSIT